MSIRVSENADAPIEMTGPAKTQSGNESKRRHFVKVMLAVVGMRIGLALILACWEVAAPTAAQSDDRYYHGVEPELSLSGQLFVKWDSYWYLNIAEHGYRLPSRDRPQSNLAFAPLYPMCIYLLTRCGAAPWIAGVVVSLVCYLLMNIFLYRLGGLWGSEELAGRLVWMVNAFPSAWVLHMVYSESMFCLCLAAFFYFYTLKRYTAAGACAFVLPLVRVAGVVLIPALLAVVVLHRWKDRTLHPSWRTLVFSAAGAVALMTIFAVMTSDPLAFAEAGRAWFRKAGVEGRFIPLLYSFAHRLFMTPLGIVFFGIFLCYLMGALAVLRKKRTVDGFFSVLYVLMLLKTPLISAQVRYLLPLLPVHAHFAQVGSYWKTILWIMLMFQLLLTRLELAWHIIM